MIETVKEVFALIPNLKVNVTGLKPSPLMKHYYKYDATAMCADVAQGKVDIALGGIYSEVV